MKPMAITPGLDTITPESLKSHVRDVLVVLSCDPTGQCDDLRASYLEAVVYPVDPRQELDAAMQQHPQVTRVDLLWMRGVRDCAAVLSLARATLKRTRWMVCELHGHLGDNGRLDAASKSLIREICDHTPGWRLVGYDDHLRVLLQNQRAGIGRKPNPATLPKTITPPAPPEPEPPPRPKDRCVTMSRLGTMGQWGNQVVQYAFIRTYAEQHDLDYAVPRWVGQHLFGFRDPLITRHYPPKQERAQPGNPHMSCLGIPIPPRGDEYANRDFVGWAQYDTAYYQPWRDQIQDLYQAPVEPEATRVLEALGTLRQYGHTLIGLHLRRGDSGRSIYPFTPVGWCLRWLHDNWNRFHDPALFIATEDTGLLPYFRHYNPVVAEDLKIAFLAEEYWYYTYPFPIEPRKARQLDFFPDWFLLQNCDVLLASDSSFSMTAAWTSRVVQEVWRPRLSLLDFEPVDPWDMHFCNREHLDDFPGIPGTSLDDNPGFGWDNFRPRHRAVPEDPATFQQWIKPPCR